MGDTQRGISGWLVVLALLLWLVGSSLIFMLGPYQRISEVSTGGPPEEQFAASSEEIETRIHEIAQTEQGAYVIFQIIDIVNASLTTIALLTALLFLTSRLLRQGRMRRALLLTPMLLLVLELAENTMLAIAVRASPESSPVLSFINWATTAKLALGGLLFVGVVLGALVWVIRLIATRGAAKSQPKQSAAHSD